MSNFPILSFILTNYKNFNARATRDAMLAYRAHMAKGGKMFWAMAGAMSSAQLGVSLSPAIRAGLIHGLSVTGANLEESLFRLVAHHSYKDFPDYRYMTKADDTRILVVPGSVRVRLQAEAEGLDVIFKEAGAEWRGAGCSMCLGMNPDTLQPG